MFNIGLTELIAILLVAFLVVGPKDLPKVARALARGIKKLRALIEDVKAEAHWDEVIDEVKDVKKSVDSAIQQVDVTREIRDVKNSVTEAVKQVDVTREIRDVKNSVTEAVKQADVTRDVREAKRVLTVEAPSELRAAKDEVEAALHAADKVSRK
ncbi:MAG: twin-arginine translocase TatA/TatE family subunit [Clostridia bacterium]